MRQRKPAGVKTGASFIMRGNKMSKKIEKKQITIRLPVNLLDLIQKLGKQERRNRSNMIEYLIRNAIREQNKEITP